MNNDFEEVNTNPVFEGSFITEDEETTDDNGTEFFTRYTHKYSVRVDSNYDVTKDQAEEMASDFFQNGQKRAGEYRAFTIDPFSGQVMPGHCSAPYPLVHATIQAVDTDFDIVLTGSN